MKLEVTGVLGIDHAEIEVKPKKITLLAGTNAQGKSSIINSAIAVLLPRPLPPGCTKKDFGERMVNEGHKSGRIKAESNHGTRIIEYPACEIHTTAGTSNVETDEWSTQQIKLHDLNETERAKELTKLTNSAPSKERLESATASLNIKPERLKTLIDTALKVSFPVASKTAEDWAKEMKGEFKAIAGQQWGSKQGMTFTPPGWEPDLEKATLEQLDAEFQKAQTNLAEAIGKAAVYRAAGDKEAIAKEITEWSAQLDKCEKEEAELRESLAKSKTASQTVTCSGCGLVGTVEQDKLVATKPAKNTTLQKEVQEKLSAATARKANAQSKLGSLKQQFDTADGVGEPIDTAPLKAAQDRAAARLAAHKSKVAGTDLHFKIVDMLKAAELLAPDGLPKTALLEGIAKLNERLATISQIAEWKKVEIRSDLRLWYDGRPYHPSVLSRTERFLCDAAFQLLWARSRRQELVVIDDVDTIVDRQARNGLFTLLVDSGLTCLVGLAVDGEAPDLEAAGIGSTYAVERGTAKLLRGAVTA